MEIASAPSATGAGTDTGTGSGSVSASASDSRVSAESGSRSTNPLDYPNRRHVRNGTAGVMICDCCVRKAIARGKSPEERKAIGAKILQQDSMQDGGRIGMIYGIAYECTSCSFTLCSACFNGGYSYHKHRPTHEFKKIDLPDGPGRMFVIHPNAPAPPWIQNRKEFCMQNQDSSIRSLTPDNYEEIVYQDDKDVLVYYYNGMGVYSTASSPELQHSQPLPMPMSMRKPVWLTSPAGPLKLSDIFAEVELELPAYLEREKQATKSLAEAGVTYNGQPFEWSKSRSYSPGVWPDPLYWVDPIHLIGFSYLNALAELTQAYNANVSASSTSSSNVIISEQTSGNAGKCALILGSWDLQDRGLDIDWVSREIWMDHPNSFMLHPAQTRKGHADLTKRNLLFQEFGAASPSRSSSSELFKPRNKYCIFQQLVEWIGQRTTQPTNLSLMLQLADPYNTNSKWLIRCVVSAYQVYSLITEHANEIDLSLLKPYLEIVQTMKDMAISSHYRLQAIDVSWCQQNCPIIERLIESILNTPKMKESKEKWLQNYEKQQKEQKTAEAEGLSNQLKEIEYSPQGIRSSRRSENDLWYGGYDGYGEKKQEEMTEEEKNVLAEKYGFIYKIVIANFETIVFNNTKDVVVGMFSEICNPFPRRMSTTMKFLIPAFAKIIRQYQSIHTAEAEAEADAGRGTSPSSTNSHGESLVFGLMLVGFSEKVVSLDATWIDPGIFSKLICDSYGGYLLYPAGNKPNEYNYDFYQIMESAYRRGINAERGPHASLLDDSLIPPTLSELICWVHGNMKGGTFDLNQVLELAAPYEKSSQQVNRMEEFTFESVYLWDYPSIDQKKYLEHKGKVHEELACPSLEEIKEKDKLIEEKIMPLINELKEIKTKLRAEADLNAKRKAKVTERNKKHTAERKQHKPNPSSSSTGLSLIRDGEANQAAVQLILQEMTLKIELYRFRPVAARLHLYSDATPEVPTFSSSFSASSPAIATAPATVSQPASRNWSLIIEILGWNGRDAGAWCEYLCEDRVFLTPQSAVTAFVSKREKPPNQYEEIQLLEGEVATKEYSHFLLPDLPAWQREARRFHQQQNEEDKKEEEQERKTGDYHTLIEKVQSDFIVNEITHLKIRDRIIQMNRDLDWLADQGIIVHYPPDIKKVEYLSALIADESIKNQLFCTDEELKEFIDTNNQNLKRILRLEDWYQPRNVTYGGVPLTNNPTYQALAQCVIDGSGDHYRQVQLAGLLPTPNMNMLALHRPDEDYDFDH